MLAIAAPSFDQPSETFIAGHVRGIAPGQTVLICQRGGAPEGVETAVHSGIVARRHRLGRLGRGLDRTAAALGLDRERGLLRADENALAAFLEHHRVTHVLAEYGPLGVTVFETCQRLGLPLTVHFHGFDASILAREAAWRRRYARMLPHLEAIVAPSRYLAERVIALGAPHARTHVNPCGVDPERFAPGTPVSGVPGRVLAIGRLVAKKAPHLSIRAFARAAAAYPEAHLDIVGEGPLREACEAEIAAHRLEGRVTLHGSRPHAEVQRLMAEAAVFAQHSVEAPDGDIEGLPVAVLEAMAAAVPVLATRHSGIPEAVAEGETGLLVDEHDVEAMAEALCRLLGDPTQARAMGVAGRARVMERFSNEISLAGLRRILGLTPACAETPPTAARTPT
ncbi:MAG: glycosyltransferase [Pseudomonadota bacterium]